MFYLRIIVLLLILSACSHREKDGSNSLLSFVGAEKQIPLLTIPEYRTWLADPANNCCVTFENDSCKIFLQYRPAALETALTVKNSGAQFNDIYKEKDKYHLFVAECLDKRSKSAMNLSGGRAFINKVSEGIFLVENKKDTIIPMVEIFPSSLLNRPGYVYIFIPRDNTANIYTAGLNRSVLGNTDAISITIDSAVLAHLPKIKR